MTNVEMILATIVQSIEGQANIFGPVFPRLVAQNWVKFVAEKLGETPPNVESLDQAIEYVKTKTEKYPRAYTGDAYATSKAIGLLEGHVGAGGLSLARDLMKDLMNSMSLDQAVGPTSDTTDALNKYVQCMEAIDFYRPGMMTCSGDGVYSILHFHDCEYIDACNRLLKEGIKGRTGEIECFFGTVSAVAVEVVTKKRHDYRNTKIAPPNCEIEIYQTK